MDFALSPDWPALWCYFIILAIGFVVATVQINRLFPGFPQAWIYDVELGAVRGLSASADPIVLVPGPHKHAA